MRLPERHGLLLAVALMGWLTLVLWLDRIDGAGSLWRQRCLGMATWLVLSAALVAFAPLVRVQTLVVVGCATAVEFTFSPLLEVYLYRFHNVPMYVPPGHGLVYLSAFALGHWPPVQRHLKAAAVVVVVAVGAWASYGWLLARRPDELGFFWFLCLAGFVAWGPSRPVYVGAAVVVTWLELAGTHLGTWAWQPHDPILGVAAGNPPSGAAGGYGWFDLAGLLLAPWLVAVFSRGGRRRSPPKPLAADVH
ncbi:MAG: hypothetical protein M3Y66_01540 [Actinomycetota bacterium]|nr:hypothetical protein [Actinomycetota bacterium]